MSFSANAEIIDATLITSTSKVNKSGTKSYTGSCECFWDETDTSGQGALVEGATVTMLSLFEGDTSGDYSLSLSAIVDSLEISAGVDGMVEASFNWTGTGDVTRGTV
tara:strand:- start:2888 stop:3208 length:321 start_codon:yes stop_codon:yes gene_type:complete